MLQYLYFINNHQNTIKYNLLGFITCIIYISIFFCNKAGTPPSVSFNIKPFIKNSSIYIFNKHIHHWLISLNILIITIPLQIFNKHPNNILCFSNGFFLMFLLHGITYDDFLTF